MAHRIEAEHRFARHLLEQLIRPDAVADDGVRTWIAPGSHCGGDAFAWAHTPARVRYILLADAAGHGLAAAISVLPLVESFYAMVEKGCAPASVVRELNRKAHRLLPREYFVAAALAAIDPENRTVQVWNGGLPEVLFVDDHGRLARVWPSRHPPLGVLPDAAFDSICEPYVWPVSGDLLFCSNGVPARLDASGIAFGMQRVADTFAHPKGTGRFRHLTALLECHGAGVEQADDAIMVVARCEPAEARTAAGAPAPPAKLAASADEPRWVLALRLGVAELKSLDVLPFFVNWLNLLGIPASQSEQIFLILGELFNNALDHGVLRLDSRLKAEPEGFARYLEERATRLAALEAGSIEIRMERSRQEDGDWLEIHVEDSGEGFDVAARAGRTMPADRLPSGRGIALIRRLAQHLDYNAKGNAAHVRYRLNG